MADLGTYLQHKLLEKRGNGDWRRSKLHASSDLQSCLRRTCLDFLDQPQGESEEQDLSGSTHGATQRMIGSRLHWQLGKYLEEDGIAILQEHDVSEGLGGAWSGRIDALVRDPETGDHVLIDLKTVDARDIYFYLEKGNEIVKEAHVWQTSAYFWALKKLGVRVDRAAMVYWPKNIFYITSKYPWERYEYPPMEVPVDILPEEVVRDRMDEVQEIVGAWRKKYKSSGDPYNSELPIYVKPEQRLLPRPTKRNPEYYEIEQRLDWQCRYCPFINGACTPPLADVWDKWTVVGEIHYEDGALVLYRTPGFEDAEIDLSEISANSEL